MFRVAAATETQLRYVWLSEEEDFWTKPLEDPEDEIAEMMRDIEIKRIDQASWPHAPSTPYGVLRQSSGSRFGSIYGTEARRLTTKIDETTSFEDFKKLHLLFKKSLRGKLNPLTKRCTSSLSFEK